MNSGMISLNRTTETDRGAHCLKKIDAQKGNYNLTISKDHISNTFYTPILGRYHDSIEGAIDLLPDVLKCHKLPITEPWFNSAKFPGTIPTWPCTSTAWVSWVKRMKNQCESSWKKWNINKAIDMSINVPASYPTYLYTFLGFWSSDLNCFVFPWGMMGPTLLDVTMITGLPIVGQQLPEFHSRQEEWTVLLSLTRKNAQWNAFITEFQGTGEATEIEHAAFLLYWLCRYVACVGSKSVVGTYTRYVEAIMFNQPVSLGRFFLGLLFHGINRSLKKLANGNSHGTTVAGPLWFLQLWINHYFPKLFYSKTTPGLSLPYSSSERGVLRSILHRSPETKDFYQYDNQQEWPEFLSPLSNPKEEEGVEGIVLSHWNSILTPHPLMVGYEIRPAKVKNNPITVELYWPQCLARQLGCQQGIPQLTSMYADLKLVAGKPISDFQIKEIGKRRGIFQSRHSYLPFKISPAEQSEHKKWWESVRKEIFQEDLDLYLVKVPELDKIKKKTIPKPRRKQKIGGLDSLLVKLPESNKGKKKTTIKAREKQNVCATTADPAQPSRKRLKPGNVQVSKPSPNEIEVDQSSCRRTTRDSIDDPKDSSVERDDDEQETSTETTETPSLSKSPSGRSLNDDGHIPTELAQYQSCRQSPIINPFSLMPLNENSSKKRNALTLLEMTKKPADLATTYTSPIRLVKGPIVKEKNNGAAEEITKKSTALIPHQSSLTKKKGKVTTTNESEFGEFKPNNHRPVQAILSHDLDQAVSLIPELQSLLLDAASFTGVADRIDIIEKIDQLVLQTTELEGDYPIWKLRELEDRHDFEDLDLLPSQRKQLVDKHDQVKRDAHLAFSKKERLTARQAELRHVISEAQTELMNIDVELKVVDDEGASAESSTACLAEEIRTLDEKIQKSEKKRKIVTARYQASQKRMSSMEESWASIKDSWQWISSQILHR